MPAVFILQPVCSQSVYFSISGLVTTSRKSAQLEREWEGRLLESINSGWEGRLLEEFGVSAVWEGHLLDRSICGKGVYLKHLAFTRGRRGVSWLSRAATQLPRTRPIRGICIRAFIYERVQHRASA